MSSIVVPSRTRVRRSTRISARSTPDTVDLDVKPDISNDTTQHVTKRKRAAPHGSAGESYTAIRERVAGPSASVNVEVKREVLSSVEESSTHPSQSHGHHLVKQEAALFEEKTDVPAAGSSKTSSRKKFKRETEGVPAEKRLKRFRDKCPQATIERALRVRSQRMFLLDRQKLDHVPLGERFQVLGSTGNVYTIIIDQEPSCDCPDFQKGNAPCKHVVFVFLKVLKVSEKSLLWFQRGLLSTEMEEMFAGAPAASQGSVMVSTKIRNAYLKATGAEGMVEEEEVVVEKQVDEKVDGKRLSALGEDCPVCCDEMSAKDDDKGLLVWDAGLVGCGKPLHRECFQRWANTQAKKGEAATCVWCRSPWPFGAGQTGKAGGSNAASYTTAGYMNIADVAGMSRERDTSSYYWGPMRGRGWHDRYQDD